jgi:hypothetical protein
MSSYRSNSPTGHNLLGTAVMCCRHLLVACISSKLEMQGMALDYLQMGAVDCCAESCGFRYKQCCRVRSSTEVLLFTGGLLCQIGQLLLTSHQAAFLYYGYLTAPLVIRPRFGWCDPCHS